MRQPVTNPCAAALRALISAMPEDRLREFTLQILLGTIDVAPAAAIDPAGPAPAKRRTRRGWPKGKPRKVKVVAAKTRRGRRSREELDRFNEARRLARSRARAAKAADSGDGTPVVRASAGVNGCAGDGHGGAPP